MSRDPVPSAYFDAITEGGEEARELEYSVNKARSMAKGRHRLR